MILPKMGPLPGTLHLNQTLAPQTRGNARPFAPGEFLQNPDGSWSSEISATVTHPALNGGKPTNIPTLWLVNGVPTRLDPNQAAMAAANSGLKWEAFNSLDAADASAAKRETSWQSLAPSDSWRVPPLYDLPRPTPRPGLFGSGTQNEQ